ncbi:MAG: hypothetical protein A2632_02165 [Candidatus Pacebacteria bacterium RIFCSPHIGHO2_01_FULL_46_16]|nr:MAG: hypothetical protein A3E86_04810 [Candidatus Daviesbacteria bacterium RIFCSPHIGHO2_12_FULL_47_45]OGJ15737.1 MAG: hypothetical protein A2632_02165 [Candidatus Pacebacteria bacterium RIFCSPHIGHO2_01_FULL_46_16]OGJ38192.1 MAG: hypothetical protein A3A82_01125 [Candidatus Pacebacteria bacterium RIFCSPLOWO2_01_FULL_47_12]
MKGILSSSKSRVHFECGFTLIVGNKDNQELLKNLGKHKTSGGCLYIKRLLDVDKMVLTQLIEKSFQHMKEAHS